MLNIALVDDHAVVRQGYRRLLELEDDMKVVAEFAEAQSAYRAFSEGTLGRVDLVVLDLSLPGASGLDLLRRLAQRCPQLKVLIFTMYDSVAMVTQCLRAGAAGFVTKNSEPALLVDAVRRAARGELPLSPDVAQAVRQGAGSAPHAALSPRAFVVFLSLVDGHSVEDIAQTLRLSGKTVANYQTQIRRTLGVDSSVELLRYAQRHGLVTL